MAMDRRLLSLILLLLTAAAMAGVTSAAAGPFLSDGVFQVTAGSTGRRLLQAQKNCPISFEVQNYTIITSKCKGPNFPASQCCAAFKEFACPFSMYINDASSTCATEMFSYINLNGHYPPGLFSSECREGEQGLSCANVTQKDTATSIGGQQAQSNLLASITLVSVVAALFFH